jgi:hypothetical protein
MKWLNLALGKNGRRETEKKCKTRSGEVVGQ